MGNVVWLRRALVWRHIATTTGEESAIVDFRAEGATLRDVHTRAVRTIGMAEIHTAIRLWGPLRRAPHGDELREAGVAEANLAYVVPLVVEIKGLPQVRAWQGARVAS